MLSKVAERLYWTARYLERIENTARLISVYDNLLFDLPREIDISWYHLVTLNGADALFEERYRNQEERNVVKFLLADDTNPASMLSAMRLLRENVRTTRDVMPQESWELINELYLFAKENIQQGINRSGRHQFLDETIKSCQQINGLFIGTMSRDASWQFLSMGRNLERADMVTRLLDAGAAAQIQGEAEARFTIGQVIWGNVLRSSSAELNYRRTLRSAVRDIDVAEFLLADQHFPRSLRFCLGQIRAAAEQLPNGSPVLARVDHTLKLRYALDESADLDEEFRDFLNQVQLDLGGLHNSICETWFALQQEAVA